MSRQLFYVTNRRHKGGSQFKPKGYGTTFSADGAENLRFGKITIKVNEQEYSQLLQKAGEARKGAAKKLSKYLKGCLTGSYISAFIEDPKDPNLPETAQPDILKGSDEFFPELRTEMSQGRDVIIFVHGYSVSWKDAVVSALQLQEMINRRSARGNGKPALVVLFTWPSDGKKLPWTSYRSDRSEAAASGYALGRALLKMRDYLASLTPKEYCGRDLNLLCHSMGNFLLENALHRMSLHAAGRTLPTILDQVFLCSPDVDDNAFEQGNPLSRLTEICHGVHVYFNKGDTALHISDRTKGNPDRLGNHGVARPALLHRKVRMIDCSPVVGGFTEHSYYMEDPANRDIRQTLDGVPDGDPSRHREPSDDPQSWVLKKPAEVGGKS